MQVHKCVIESYGFSIVTDHEAWVAAESEPCLLCGNVAVPDVPKSHSLNGLTWHDSPCNCGEWHATLGRMTASERRRANRERVAENWNITAYELYAAAEDAWTRRTLNLDALLSAGRI